MRLHKFVELVEKRAENKMLKTGKLEGAHYAAMKELANELEDNLEKRLSILIKDVYEILRKRVDSGLTPLVLHDIMEEMGENKQ